MSNGPSRRARLTEEKLARAALTYLAEPGDPALGALLAVCDPAEVLAAIKADTSSEVSQSVLADQIGRASLTSPDGPGDARPGERGAPLTGVPPATGRARRGSRHGLDAAGRPGQRGSRPRG